MTTVRTQLLACHGLNGERVFHEVSLYVMKYCPGYRNISAAAASAAAVAAAENEDENQDGVDDEDSRFQQA